MAKDKMPFDAITWTVAPSNTSGYFAVFYGMSNGFRKVTLDIFKRPTEEACFTEAQKVKDRYLAEGYPVEYCTGGLKA